MSSVFFDRKTNTVIQGAGTALTDENRYLLIAEDIVLIVRNPSTSNVCCLNEPLNSPAHLFTVKQGYTEILWERHSHPLDQLHEEAVAPLGQKYDTNKLRYSLLPQDVLEPVIQVLEYGAKKYSKDNWKHVDNARERYYDAAMRHLQAWFNGEAKDPETNESHLAHAMCCLMFLLWFENK